MGRNTRTIRSDWSVPDNPFTLEGYAPQSNLNRLNLGIGHKLAQDLVLRANYNIRKDDRCTQQGIDIGISIDLWM